MTAHQRVLLYALAAAVLASAAVGLAFDLTRLAWVVVVTLATLPGLAIVSFRPHAVPTWLDVQPVTIVSRTLCHRRS